ncbi:hypothetical protein BCPG_04005 [Burkholderia cenocepacia PC184]|nr:hypothetical protein BCPG_04005 [Burkholderia cenocepacia PC184]
MQRHAPAGACGDDRVPRNGATRANALSRIVHSHAARDRAVPRRMVRCGQRACRAALPGSWCMSPPRRLFRPPVQTH